MEFLLQGETVTAEYWVFILFRLKDSIRHKQPILWRGGFDGQTDHNFVLHMDNAPVHTSINTLAFYGEQNFPLSAHPAYSPDLAPCDFWAFPTLKSKMRGTKFRPANDAQQKVQHILRVTLQEEYE